jgi:hypothetical protein
MENAVVNPLRLEIGALSAWTKFGLAYAAMATTASEVIWRRSLMMAQGAMSHAEATRMVSEKAAAFAAASSAAAVAMAAGKDVAAIAAAALKPYGTHTRANRRRLAR